MSLIDKSYFTGKLTIAQLGQPAVVDNLSVFINREEPLFLQAALGYDLWLDFVNGLNAPSIDQKWLNLRDGVDFKADGLWPPFQWRNGWMNYNRDWFIPQNPVRTMHWVGFCGGAPIVSSNNSFGSILTLICGTPNAPIAGTKTVTLAQLAGATYDIERRGFGTMVPGVDVAISNNGQTITLLKVGDQFAYGEVFILHFTSVQSTGLPSVAYTSPLAAYVYYQWFVDQAANLSAMGIVEGQAENATGANAMLKMSDAWDRMAKDILMLWQFIDTTSRQDPTVYSSYDRLKIDYNFFKPINKYGF